MDRAAAAGGFAPMGRCYGGGVKAAAKRVNLRAETGQNAAIASLFNKISCLD